MAYFIFSGNLDNVNGTLAKIAEDQTHLNNSTIVLFNTKIIEDSSSNFDDNKYGNKIIRSYTGDIINYEIVNTIISSKEEIIKYIENYKSSIKSYLDNNPNHIYFNIWNDYYNQLNSFDVNSIQYPLNKSLEQYFKEQNKPSLNPLQIP
jgi:hypothetical protein